MRRHSERAALPHRGSGMCQSFTSVPRTYVRTADELEPLSPGARLASFPTLLLSASTSSRAQSPICQLLQHQRLQQHPLVPDDNNVIASRRGSAQQRRRRTASPPPPALPILPPKALPAGLPKALRPSKLPPKNLDELDPLRQVSKEPGTALLGKCVLCLLLNAVFVLALFLAFLIGHFAAESHLPFSNKTNNGSSSSISRHSLLLAGAGVGTTPLVPRQTTAPHHPPAGTNDADGTHPLDPQEQEFQKSLERSRQRVPSLKEVYPPYLNGDGPTDDADDPLPLSGTTAAHLFGNGPVMHRSAGTLGQNVPLIPLPNTVVPRHYNVDIDLTEFYGLVEPSQLRANVSILLEAFGNATAADDELMFHAGANIFIQRVQLWRQQGTTTPHGDKRDEAVPIRSVKRHAEREIARLLLGERMKPGWYWLEMEFRTRICRSEFEGAHCFPNPTANNQKQQHSAAGKSVPTPSSATSASAFSAAFGGFSTKFEPNFARTFLPGWDEPRFRSTFNVTIRHFVGAKVLTNTAPIASTVPTAGDNVCRTHFGTTPPMPLFLLAFATGPFTAVEVRTSRANIPLTVWAAPQHMLAAHFVANFSPAMLERLQEDFGVKFPLAKLDLFLAPKLPVGGMENWGLIVLHADAVRMSTSDGPLPLGTDSSSSASSSSLSSSREERVREAKQHNLALVDRRSEQYRAEKAITHELVHQWFGNLVGIWEWEELWIAEGFATYFVFDFLNAANHPHLTEHEYYLRLIELIHRQSADGRSALVRPLRTAGQLFRLFDGIHLYTKGSVMVKMLKDLVGPAEFRAGITRFLRENAFKSVDRRALWAAFPTVADHGVDAVRLRDAMEPWLVNRGVPEVEVYRNYADQSVRLRQRPADQNRHIVYLDDEAMHRMRMVEEGDEDEDDDETGRMRKVGRKHEDEKEDDKRKMRTNDDEERMMKRVDDDDKDDYGQKMMTDVDDDENDHAGWMRMKGIGRKHKNDLRGEPTTEKDIDGILGWMADELVDDMNRTTKSTRNVTTETDEDAKTKARRRHHQHRKKQNNGHRSKSFFLRRRGGGATGAGDQQKGDQRQQQEWNSSNSKKSGGGTVPPIFSAWSPRRTSISRTTVRTTDQQQQQQRHVFTSLHSSADSGGAMPTEQWRHNQRHEFKARHSRGDQQQQQKRRRADDAQQLLGPLWPVPFSYAFGSAHSVRGQTIRQFWLLNETLRFVDVGLDRAQHMLANPHWVYAYRVNYDTQNWRMLIAQLHKNHQEVPTMSRMQLIVDGETFLRQSANPQLFVQLLSYLANEDDLGVLLVGLDALHALLELFSASDLFGPMLLHFVPVIRQLDRQLSLTAAHGTDPELAALWLLSPLRLAKLYQLRCAANFGTCAETKQVRRWLAHPTALAADNHQQLSALCHHLFAHAGPGEVALLSGLLKQFSNGQPQQQQQIGSGTGAAFAAVIRQLCSACVQDEALVKLAVADILRTRNAIVYSEALNSGYSVNYNRKFRELFWTGLAQQLSIHERQVLFAVNTGKSNRMARILLHSIRSLGELNLVERVVLHQWPESLRVEMDYLRRKLSWTEREACEQIRKQLVLDAATKRGGEKDSRRR